MKTEDFDYHLPEDLIAQTPCQKRGGARLMVLGEGNTPPQDRQFSEFAEYCEPGDLLVVNNTRVVPARLQCRKASGGRVEVMLERMLPDGSFLALVRSNRPLKVGTQLYIDERAELEFVEREGGFFRFKLLNQPAEDQFAIFNQRGDVPLPPYIRRTPQALDVARYQTVYAQSEGAVAAPTAGLHFDRHMLEKLQRKGVEKVELTLHVGAGTFQPVKVSNIREHRMHQEWIEVGSDVVAAIERCKKAGKRVIAIGTTTVRALESAAKNGALNTYSGPTDIFIYPGYPFQVVDLLLTNFHLPRSTLLMMISAFAGTQRVRDAYAHAVEKRYRFFSYGDAMLISHASNQEPIG